MMSTPKNTEVSVSILIKALNEQENIANTIRSALSVLAGINGEVILADSYSTDRTIEFAKSFNIKIVQLQNPQERCCGIGAQLGYQFSEGEFIWIVDGDMELSRDFLGHAIEKLLNDHSLGGVGGIIVEKNLDSLEFRARVERAAHQSTNGIVDRLDGGGVYRRATIEKIGYLTNRNLHSYEEYELGARIRSKGWKLFKLPLIASLHYGHKQEAFSLLCRRWRSKYAFGIGELIRSSIGTSHLRLVLKEVREIRIYAAVVFWWFLLLAGGVAMGMLGGEWLSFTAFIFLAPFLYALVKKRSFEGALYAVASWNVYAAGMIRGLLSRQHPTGAEIAAKVIQ